MDTVITKKLQDSHQLYPIYMADGRKVKFSFCFITDEENLAEMIEKKAPYKYLDLECSAETDVRHIYFKDLPISAIIVKDQEDLKGALSIPSGSFAERAAALYKEHGKQRAFTFPDLSTTDIDNEVEHGEQRVFTIPDFSTTDIGDEKEYVIPVLVFMFKDPALWEALLHIPIYNNFPYKYMITSTETLSVPEIQRAIQYCGIDGIYFSLWQFIWNIHVPYREGQVLSQLLDAEEKCVQTLISDIQKIMDKQAAQYRRWKIYSVTAGILLVLLIGLLFPVAPELIAKLKTLFG